MPGASRLAAWIADPAAIPHSPPNERVALATASSPLVALQREIL